MYPHRVIVSRFWHHHTCCLWRQRHIFRGGGGFKILLRDYPGFKVMGCHVTFLFSNFTAAVSFRHVVHSWVRSPYLEDARSGKVPFIRRVFGNPGVVDLRSNFFNAGCICASLPLIHTQLHMYAKVISYLWMWERVIIVHSFENLERLCHAAVMSSRVQM